ncbi:MAG: hypothetical protein JNK05_21385 [Myxococcales bacterium]|nr:hypothetical protein [Myxococcales bacterium]
MLSIRSVAPFALSLVLVACGGMQPLPSDGGNDARSDTGTGGGDSGRPDTGVSSDRCSAGEMNAVSTVGCNGGFAMGMPAMNTPGGACMGGGEANPMGSCPANHVCTGDMGMSGVCLPTCNPGSTYVSTGGCPTGFRCFQLSAGGLCFRDCNAANACPMGQMCDPEGSCVEPAPMMKH